MRRLFDFVIDTFLFFGDIICHLPTHILNMIEKVFRSVSYIFSILPFKISLVYRFRKIWYPTKSDFDSHKITNEMYEWLNTDLGKYRWQIISRLTNYVDSNHLSEDHLCFRYKTDAMAFKLKWS